MISRADLIVWGMPLKEKYGNTESDKDGNYYREKINALGKFPNGMIQQDLQYMELVGWIENPERAPKAFKDKYLELLKTNSLKHPELLELLSAECPKLSKAFLEKYSKTTFTDSTEAVSVVA